MKEFEYKIRGKGDPYGRQNVFFTCHPSDFRLYFEQISQIILKKYDCTIWYCQEKPDDEKEYAIRISEMQLLVIPVTEKFLTGKNRARDFDLPFALEHHIPVLPLLLTSGLEEQFAKICGDIHFIDRNACDTTTLTFEEKIIKFLSATLVSDELMQKIKEAFYARIFLSYRKKDRVLANKLMKLIHDIPFCWDISIWFDEYLVPGESFNHAIAEAMRNSHLFVLCVTENLIEEGNYVQLVEYPKAREMSLPVLPIIPEKMTFEQRELLKKKYEDIPDGIEAGNTEQLKNCFYKNFTDIAVSVRSDDPMHLFFIGLAYLNGIDVELDYDRATELISQASNANYAPAMEKLANMYRIGEGVSRNYEMALSMYEKLINVISKTGDKKKSYEIHCEILRLLLDSDILFRAEHVDSSIKHTSEVLDLASKIDLGNPEIFNLFSLLAFVNEHDEQVSDKFVSAALEVLPTVCENDDDIMVEKAYFYSRLAGLYYRRNAGLLVYHITSDDTHEIRRKQSRQYIEKAIDLLEILYEKDPIRWKVNYADALNIFCRMNYAEPFSSEQIIVDSMERAIELYRELYEENALLYAEKIASLCGISGNYLAVEYDMIWENDLGILINLNSEQFVPNKPEQKILLEQQMDQDDEVCDIRRIRKALSLIRYSVTVYENYVAKGQDDCWIELAEAYFDLSMLLNYFSQWIDNVQQDNIDEIYAQLLTDGFDGYKKMLIAMRKYAFIVSSKFHDIKGKKFNRVSCAKNGSYSEKELVDLEYKAYDRDPFVECYNFAIRLYDNDLEEEANQLHEALYHFFKEVEKDTDSALVLMNLSAYASSKNDMDERLALLLEFDDSDEDDVLSGWQGRETLFSHYCEIAECYMKKYCFSNANKYFGKAKKISHFFRNPRQAIFNKKWSECKKNMGDFAGAENKIWEGLESLLSMKHIPKDIWNDLSHEYVSLLIQTGREKEANEWRNEMFIN